MQNFKKKLLSKAGLTVGTIALVVAGAAAFSAFEAHVVNVTAKISNALAVSPGSLEFGTVFPQEYLEKEVRVALSQSFLEADRVDDIEYSIKQKPKVKQSDQNDQSDPYATITVNDTEYVAWQYCEENLPQGEYDSEDEYWNHCYLPLASYLSKHKSPSEVEETNDTEVDAFHQAYEWEDGKSRVLSSAIATGRLAKSEDDLEDNWIIDLAVPCFTGYCAQDWADFVGSHNPGADPSEFTLDPNMEHEIFGTDLWIEVTEVSRRIVLYEELGDETEDLGPIKGYVTYTHNNDGSVKGTVKVDEGYLSGLYPEHTFLLVLNGPRGASTAPGSTNDLLANKACATDPGGSHSPGWDGWWSNKTDNTGVTDVDCDGFVDGDPVTNLEGYYNFAFDVTAAELEAGYDYDVSLPAGHYFDVQFLIKDLDTGWNTVLEYPGVGETGSSASLFDFVVN